MTCSDDFRAAQDPVRRILPVLSLATRAVVHAHGATFIPIEVDDRRDEAPQLEREDTRFTGTGGIMLNTNGLGAAVSVLVLLFAVPASATFDDPVTEYGIFPQTLDDDGVIQGHSHVTTYRPDTCTACLSDHSPRRCDDRDGLRAAQHRVRHGPCADMGGGRSRSMCDERPEHPPHRTLRAGRRPRCPAPQRTGPTDRISPTVN